MRAAPGRALDLAGGALALLPVLAFAVFPVLALVGRGTFALGAEALSDLTSPEARTALANTALTSGGAAGVALALGTPLSLLLFRTDLMGRGLLRALFTLPSAIPPFIWGMGWVFLANPRAGLLNRLLGEGTLDIYGAGGIAFVLGGAGLPLVVLAGAQALTRVDPALEEAARLCGASPFRALWSVSLPLALPALFSGAGLVFLFAASAFGVPYMLGVTANPPTVVLTTRIYSQVLMGGQDNLSRALALSTLLLVLATCVLLGSQFLGRAGRVRLSSGKGLAERPLPLGRARAPLSAAAFLLAFVLVALPLGAIFLTSVQPTFGAPLSLSTLTFSHWGAVLGSSRTLSAAARSLTLAAGAGVLVCAFGLAVSLARGRLGRLGRLAETLASWPYAVPGTVLAMALLVAFSRELRFVFADRVAFILALGNSLWILLVAYAGKYLVLGTRNLSEGLTQVDPSLAEAARVFGASRSRAFVDATLPLLRPALATAFVLTFLTCATELTMSVLLVPAGKDVLGTLLFELQSYADPAAASVLACGFVLLVLLGMTSLAALGQRARRGAAR
ncbi:MAG: ABC transporter permease [Myxococcaceae bacterium]